MGTKLQDWFFNLLRKKRFYFFILVVAVIVFPIVNRHMDIRRMIKHKDELVALAKNKTITNEEDRNYYTLETYTSDRQMRNKYYFRREEKKGKIYYTLFRDTLQFNPDTVIHINKESGTYLKEIVDYFQKVTRVLDSYEIKSLSGKGYRDSPRLLNIYPKSGRLLRYDPDAKESDYEGCKKIQDGWYMQYSQ